MSDRSAGCYTFQLVFTVCASAFGNCVWYSVNIIFNLCYIFYYFIFILVWICKIYSPTSNLSWKYLWQSASIMVSGVYQLLGVLFNWLITVYKKAWILANICFCLPPDRTWHKVNDLKVDFSGDLGEGKVRIEPRLEPRWILLVIGPLSAMWAWWA